MVQRQPEIKDENETRGEFVEAATKVMRHHATAAGIIAELLT